MEEQCEAGEDPAEESEEEKPLVVVIPEEVVEMIIAKLSFRSLFQARLLSSSWNDKFFRLSTGLTPFQMEVKSLSNKWPIYSPAFFSRAGICGFDRTTSQWKSLCTLFGVYVERWGSSGSYSFLGSLTLAMSNSEHDRAMYVTNVLTGSSTQLHLELQQKNWPVVARILPGNSDRIRVIGDSEGFRVFLLYKIWNDELRRDELQTALYDSSVDGWSVTVSTNLVPEEDFFHFFHDTVYFHGKLYCLCKGVDYRGNTIRLMIHNVDSDNTWIDHVLLGYARWETAAGGIFVCGEKVMVVTLQFINYVLRIYEVDLNWFRPVKASKRMPEFGGGGRGSSYYKLIRFASDDDFIYCSHPMCGTQVMTYNVHTGEWGSLPPRSMDEDTVMLGSGFAPGMNLFAVQGGAGPRLSLRHA